MDASGVARSTFSAATGAPGYDSIRFSGEPRVDLLSAPESAIELVRHIGIDHGGMAMAALRNPLVSVIMINLCSSGSARARCGDFRIEKMLQRGHVSFLPGALVTDLEFPAIHSVLGLLVPAPRLGAVFDDMGVGHALPIFSDRHDRLAQLVGVIEGELRAPGFASDLMIDGLIRAIATILVRHESPQADRDPDRIRLSPRRLARVVDFVEAQLESEVSLGDMARVAGLSPFHFSRVFKLTTGETPYHFLSSRRLNRARQLLIADEMSLAELALACGFASQSHFTAAFTKAMGVAPGRFRKQHRSAPQYADKINAF